MRKLKLQVQMTLDGYMAGPNGEMDWTAHDWDDDLKHYVKEITDNVDCIVLGRKLAEGFIPHWASNPQLEGADVFNTLPKVVFTNTLNTSPWKNTVLAKDNLVDEIIELKSRHGKDIIAYGGATFVSALTKNRLIDDLHLFINPVAIGNGMKIFSALEGKQNYTLVKASPFACGIVVLHYVPKVNED